MLNFKSTFRPLLFCYSTATPNLCLGSYLNQNWRIVIVTWTRLVLFDFVWLVWLVDYTIVRSCIRRSGTASIMRVITYLMEQGSQSVSNQWLMMWGTTICPCVGFGRRIPLLAPTISHRTRQNHHSRTNKKTRRNAGWVVAVLACQTIKRGLALCGTHGRMY